MQIEPLGNVLVIANPAARSGAGARGIEQLEALLAGPSGAVDSYEVARTASAGHAVELAARGADFDTVIALGGDGVIHEVVCGLMGLPRDRRPRLGIIPLGSGNDYARTVGMARNNVAAAFEQLVGELPRSVEVGRVNGVPFMETLSFGLDAAIALDTTDRRAAQTSQRGAALFATSGLKIFAGAGRGFPCRVSFDDAAPLDLCSVVCAFQVGPTYGGGFRICPDARPDDGLLDVCYNVRRPPVPGLLALFCLARWGLHARFKTVELRRVRRAVLDFESEPPCQVDGERLAGTHFEIEVEPDALDVIWPGEAERQWGAALWEDDSPE